MSECERTISVDKFTGKPVPETRPRLRIPNGEHCDDCGTELVDQCWLCGAPVCCPRCCAETQADERKA